MGVQTVFPFLTQGVYDHDDNTQNNQQVRALDALHSIRSYDQGNPFLYFR